MQILLYEDNIALADHLELGLQILGHDVFNFFDEALTTLSSTPPDFQAYLLNIDILPSSIIDMLTRFKLTDSWFATKRIVGWSNSLSTRKIFASSPSFHAVIVPPVSVERVHEALTLEQCPVCHRSWKIAGEHLFCAFPVLTSVQLQ